MRLYVNDRVDVALAVGADGVHLGGDVAAPAESRAIAPALAIAVSTHGLAEVARGARDPARVAFAVFGPIRDTPSKRRYGPPLGIGALAEAARAGLPLAGAGRNRAPRRRRRGRGRRARRGLHPPDHGGDRPGRPSVCGR